MHELRPRSGANPIRKFILFDRGGQSHTPQPPQFFLSAPVFRANSGLHRARNSFYVFDIFAGSRG